MKANFIFIHIIFHRPGTRQAARGGVVRQEGRGSHQACGQTETGAGEVS